jgi:threonine/homoserine/homoserine lactone efflux protein
MTKDILSAIPWGILLAFTIGPVFFVLLETSAIKGFRAASVLDVGVVTADVFFILIAYFSTNTILEKLKDDPGLFVFGGMLLFLYGMVSFIKCKRDYHKKRDEEIEMILPKNNYLNLFLKGFLLNFINIGVLGFWLGIIIIFGPKLDMQPERISTFIITILITCMSVDCVKILLAKQLKNKLTALRIFKIKRIISIVLMLFGTGLIAQGFFPEEKEKIKEKIENISNH